MFQRTATYLKADNSTGWTTLGPDETTEQVAQRVAQRGGSLLCVKDSRYNPRQRDAIVNAWLNGADLAQLERIHSGHKVNG